MSAPAYRVFKNLLSNSFCIYDDRGPVLGYEDIDCLASAEAHIADLIEADRLRAEQEAAQLADDHAAADAMAFSLASSSQKEAA